MSVVDPFLPLKAAVIVVEPWLSVRASPPVTVATELTVELQAAAAVTSCVLLSEKVAVAANCCFNPFGTEGAAGVTAIEETVGPLGMTVKVVDA